ncbi:serine hydrolase domain-containing protein [Pseudemcibacter aquimaris]|uniref:serine hydrolase domain-containing protein n=1 Tax=Pseudemcibacter aquimaris TaxID=2857064 RepID=UPI002011FEEA|nr:serine hydrolase domain-containing protein [Pseudemcibacter aquimaris]MCC3859750.1 beta-lactamase family protein [Pseudemcibacter aquimaris]WDU60144.1 beta-lactamase family protein [Pseudemcibacter aquimaris]
MRKLLLLITLFVSHVAFAEDADNAIKIKELMENSDFNGAVLVARDGNVIFKEAYGIANVTTGEKLTTDSAFELASISKTFTAVAIHQLVEAGKMRFDDPVTKYFPKLPYDNVTIAGLLSHTSGLFDVYEEVEMREQHFANYRTREENPELVPYGNDDYLAFLEKYAPELLAGPYELSKYSNTAYVLLGLIIEQLSGQAYDDYINEYIYRPAGMTESFQFSMIPTSERPEYVKGHRINDDGDIKRSPDPDAPPRMRGETYGDDDMVSTLDDMLKFDVAIREGWLIGPEIMIGALKPIILKNGTPSHYGLGFAIDQVGRHRYVGHSGSTSGFITYMQFGLSGDNHTIILLSNMRNTKDSIRDLYASIRNIVAD